MERELSIYYIPIEDINQYLADNGIPLPIDKKESYRLAAELIASGVTENIPFTISNWIIANDVDRTKFADYTISDIIQANDDDLIKLAEDLGLDTVEKDRMIDILSYTGNLTNDLSIFDVLPEEALVALLESLDYKALLIMRVSYEPARKIINCKYFTPIFKQKRKEYLDRVLEHSNITGIIDDNDQFYIIDKNRTGMRRGLASGAPIGKAIPKAYLIDVLWRIDLTPYSNLEDVTNKNRNQIIDKLLSGKNIYQLKDKDNKPITDRTILENWSNEKLTHYYKLLYGKFTTQQISDLIRNRLDAAERIEYQL